MSSHYSGPESTDSYAAVSQNDAIRQLVENQDRIAQQKGGWAAVMSGNIEAVMKLYPGEDVYERGRYGENVFLLSLSLATPQSITIAKYLAKTYGSRLVKTPYQSRVKDTDDVGQFEGQTALHLAIVNNDIEMAKYLIGLGADVRARAIGTFFKYGGNAYYGEYPMHFACALGNKDIALLLRRHGAVPTDKDTQGNTPLHLAVLHGQLEMYDYLIDVLGAKEGVRNRQGLTPLMLAAYLGDLEMFHHIYSKRIKVAWRYGKIHSYWIPLNELDVANCDEDQELTVFGVMIRTGQLHLLQDPVMQKIFESKLRKVGFIITLSALMHLMLLITITFLVDRTINGARSGIILALHIVVVVYATVQLLQSGYLFCERCWRTSKYLQEQVERTSLVPIYTGMEHDGGANKVTPSTTRRATHSHRKSFEVPKQVAMAIKTSIAMGFQGLIGGGKKARTTQDKEAMMQLTRAPTQKEGSEVPAAGPRPATTLPADLPGTGPASPPPSPPPVDPPTDGNAPSSSGATTNYSVPSGGYQNRTRVVKKRSQQQQPGQEGGADDGPSTSSSGAAAADPKPPGKAPRGPSRFSSQGRMENSAADTMPGNLQDTIIAEERATDAASENASGAKRTVDGGEGPEDFRDVPEAAGGHTPLTTNMHNRFSLVLMSARNEMYFSAFEISLWVELAFYFMVIIYFSWWGRNYNEKFENETSVNTPATRVLLALFVLLGWISGLFVLRAHPAMSRLLAILERVLFITGKTLSLYIFVNLSFSLALFCLRAMVTTTSTNVSGEGSRIDTIPSMMLHLVRATFSADQLYDLTATEGTRSNGVIRAFLIIFAVGYYFMTLLVGMVLLRSVLSPDELRGDRGDRDVSYWHYHVGMNLLRVWSGVPKFMRKKLILGDEIVRPDGASLRFLQYVEGQGTSGYKGSSGGTRRSRDTIRHNKSAQESKRRSMNETMRRGSGTESTWSDDKTSQSQ